MSSPMFCFKRFTVWHDRCAMKVGTDGVLVGAWCPLPLDGHGRTLRVLDIGTGSGLIALMVAQRLADSLGSESAIHIDAIEPDEEACQQARENFRSSPWASCLAAEQSSLQEWEGGRPVPYDLIVSNPPYFVSSLKNPDKQRLQARHTDSLPFETLVSCGSRLLVPGGLLALILPFEAEETLLSLARTNRLAPIHTTHVYSKPNRPIKRSLLAFSASGEGIIGDSGVSRMPPITDTLVLESDTSPRSEAYQSLTRGFYL